MSSFSAVFFDFDGTFADTGRGIFKCLDYACDCLGKPRLALEKRSLFVGPPLFDSFTQLIGCTNEEANYGISKYREMYNKGGMLELDVYEGIPELIDELNEKGIKTAICSSKPAMFVRRILQNLSMENKIDFISCPEGDNTIKTKEQMINDAVAFFGICKDDAVMVGDRHFDIDGAKAAGVKSIGAAYGYGGDAELKECGADYIAGNVSDVRKFVFSRESR